MKCTNCGAELAPGDRFCMKCGARLPEEPAPVVQGERAEAQPPPPAPVFAGFEPEAQPSKKGSRGKWAVIGCLGLLAIACSLAALLGPSLAVRLSESGGLTIALPGLPGAEPTSAPSPTSTWPSAPSPTRTQQPAPSPTLTRQPAPSPTAPAPTAEGIRELFSCTSTDAECGWETHSDASTEVYAEGPELFLVARGPYAQADTEIPGVLAQDFLLSFIAKLTSSEAGAGRYGAAFRYDPANDGTFYEFELLPSGEYTVWEWVNNDPTIIESGPVEMDPSGENSVAVMAQGPWLSFMVNGYPVTDITDAEVRAGPLRLLATVLGEEAEIEVAISEVVVEAQGSPSPRPSSTTAPTSVPPSPTPTQPGPTVAPPNPTPTRGPVEFDPIVFAQAVDAEGYPVRPSMTLPSGTTIVYAVWTCRGTYEGLEVQSIWYHDGQEYLTHNDNWDGTAESGHWWLSLYRLSGAPLPSGDWRLELYVGGQLLQSGTFTIQ